jgi:hypothetical protein
MTTFVIDAPVAINLAADGATIPPEHSLAAPTLLRSQALALVYESVHRGEIDERTGRKVLDDIRGLRIRLLGDRSLQDHAWRIAAKLNWPSTSHCVRSVAGSIFHEATRSTPKFCCPIRCPLCRGPGFLSLRPDQVAGRRWTPDSSIVRPRS